MTTVDGILDGLARPSRPGSASPGEEAPERELSVMRYAARVRPHGRVRSRFRHVWPLRRLAVAILALIGLGVMLYPSAAAWTTDRVHDSQIASYSETVGQEDPATLQQQLAAAQAYNTALPSGPVRDPFTIDGSGDAEEIAGGPANYRDTLSVGSSGMMGTLLIPKIGVSLPIFHGTSDATLAKGVGHLYGTALPIGGAGTDAVLTGHSGFANATLFNELPRLVVGDTFQIQVLGETLTYRVDQITVVLPDDTDSLQPIAGEDHVTLVTCTPIGINTHRLLVRGVRIPTPAGDTGSHDLTQTIVSGFPWWALVLAGAIVVIVLATRPLRRRLGTGPRHAATT